MLVLSRKKDEKIVIETPEGRVIELQVTEIRGDKIRLGFEADRDILINREDAIKKHAAAVSTNS